LTELCLTTYPFQFSHTTGMTHFQNTYNLTLRRIRATIAAVEKKLVLRTVSVCL